MKEQDKTKGCQCSVKTKKTLVVDLPIKKIVSNLFTVCNFCEDFHTCGISKSLTNIFSVHC